MFYFHQLLNQERSHMGIRKKIFFLTLFSKYVHISARMLCFDIRTEKGADTLQNTKLLETIS